MAKKRNLKKRHADFGLKKDLRKNFKGMVVLFILSAVFFVAGLYLYSFLNLGGGANFPGLFSQKGFVDVFVNVIRGAPIIQDIPEIFVCENNYLDYSFDVTAYSGNVPAGNLVPENPFYLYPFSRKVSDYVNEFKIISGTLSKIDAGGVNKGNKTYAEIIYMSDNDVVDSKNFNITVLEVNNAPEIENIGVHTIWTRGENSSFNYSVVANDIEDGNSTSGNLFFSIIFTGKKLFDISSFGKMNFAANSSYIGVHNISVCVRDRGIKYPSSRLSLACPSETGGILVSCNNFSLTITDENRAPKIINHYPENLSFDYSDLNDVKFNITAYDADGTIPDVYWYVDNELKKYDSMASISNFSFGYICGFSGKSQIKIVITDGLLNDSLQWNLTVSTASCPVDSGGGGGGGGGGVACTEKWVCGQWSKCDDAKASYDSGKINYKLYELVKARCSLLKWVDSNCGLQTRECNDLKKCRTNLNKPGIAQECFYTENPDCFDKIKNCHNNSCEIAVDCGGPCSPCATCSDRIKNQNEEQVDCGGVCSPCMKETPKPSAFISILLKILLYASLIFLILCIIGATILGIRYYVLKRKLGEVSKNPYEVQNMQ